MTPDGTDLQVLYYLTVHSNAVHLIHQPQAQAACNDSLRRLLLTSPKIKQRMLSRTGNDELPTLAELVNYITAEDISCSESLNVQSESNTVCHVRQRISSSKKHQDKCNFCGDARHSSSNSAEDRQKSCKAFGKICSKCGNSNHFPSVCQSGRSNSRQVSEIVTDLDYEKNICSTTAASPYCSDASLPTSAPDLAPILADTRTEGPVTSVPLPHHVHDKVRGWGHSPAADKPTFPVTCSLDLLLTRSDFTETPSQPGQQTRSAHGCH